MHISKEVNDVILDAAARTLAGIEKEAKRNEDVRAAEHRAAMAEIGALKERLTLIAGDVASTRDMLSERLLSLRDGVDGKDGAPGPQGDPGPAGLDGTAGADGTSVTYEELSVGLLPSIETLAHHVVVSTFADYVEGPNAPKDGQDGAPGRDAPSLEELSPVIEERVSEAVLAAVSAIPAPKDGADGKDGVDGAPGERGSDGVDGKDGVDGERGADGASVAVDDVIRAMVEHVDGYVEGHIEGCVTEKLATWDKPQDGKDGKDCDMDEVAAMVVAAGAPLREASAALPALVSETLGRLMEEPDTMPDEIVSSVAKAVRLMAEAPDVSERAVSERFSEPRLPPVHVHMTANPAINMPETKAPDVHITVERQKPRKTATTVIEHDAKGRIAKFEQEELD